MKGILKVLYKNLSVIFISLFAVACTQSPALVENRSNSSKGYDYSKNNPFKIKVKKGENLYKISKQYGVGIRELIEINNLRPPYILTSGEVLKLPKAKFHMVKERDTLYAVSRSYGVDLSRLIHVNNLVEPYIIKVGARLRIPSLAEYNNYVANNDSGYFSSEPKVVAVVSNDLPKLSKKNDKAQYVLPNEVKERAVADSLQAEGNNSGIVPRLRPNDNPRPHLKPGTVIARPKNTKKTFEKASYTPPISSRRNYKATGFRWPTNGTIISRFGPKKGGLYNDGINIRAAEGSAVLASDNGKVVYAGNELRGYGNLVLLKHSNGYVTAYAHAKNLYVRKGDFVNKGQKIASVGSTGHVSVPQLHFSIRKGRKAINPQSRLPRG